MYNNKRKLDTTQAATTEVVIKKPIKNRTFFIENLLVLNKT